MNAYLVPLPKMLSPGNKTLEFLGALHDGLPKYQKKNQSILLTMNF